MVVLVVTIGALFRLKSHLWLDETATIWATSGGWAQLPARCISFSPSILYHSLILAIRSLGATSEWMLRLPSLLAVALASRLLFRMTERLWGAATAWLTLAAFVSIPGVAFAAGDVRAYGFGLLLVVWSTLVDTFSRMVVCPSICFRMDSTAAWERRKRFASALSSRSRPSSRCSVSMYGLPN